MEHRHEWRQSRIARYGLFFCSKCGSYMEPEEAKKRINAVEFLSAEDADDIAETLEIEWSPKLYPEPWYQDNPKALRNYAKTLRGE